VIQQFHPDEDGEPYWRIFEEFIPIVGDVEGAELVGEICLEELGLKWDGVDNWFC
jgi:hypothetical protein